MNEPLNIALIEPFFSGSHKQWAEGLIKHSRHQFEIFSLPGKHWKWRMYGGAIKLAEEFLRSESTFDLILTTDMLDLNLFLSLTRTKSHNIPIVTYFHENQLTYPWSSKDKESLKNRDRHYSFINYTTALATDSLIFNSNYHHRSFFDALPQFLKILPDHKTLDQIPRLEEKSRVLHVGMDFNQMRGFEIEKTMNDSPVILWNHRWEEDKNPAQFHELLKSLKEYDFKLVLLGERSGECEALSHIEQEFSDRILFSGFCDTREEYIHWLYKCDLLPITSNQDFFGISIVEAIHCGVIPFLPDRLSYRELLPESCHKDLIYNSFESLVDKVLSSNYKSFSGAHLISHIRKFNWKKLIEDYDSHFSQMIVRSGN